MNDIFCENNRVIIKNVANFDLAQTLDCGQAFRFKETGEKEWTGVCGGRVLKLLQTENEIIIRDLDEADFYGFFEDYFDLSRDYGKIIDEISDNEILSAAAAYGSGIRILNQEPFETLCSFII